MASLFGWRARIGLIIPALNTVAEPWLAAAAPPGVTVHTARLPMGSGGLHDMDAALPDALAMLVSAGVDVILYGCTSSGMAKGLRYETAFRAEMEQQTGIPVVTAALSVVDALRSAGARRISVLSPYVVSMEEVERRFLGDAGFEVIRIRSLGFSSRDLAAPAPKQIYREARRAWDPSSDALFISCLNFRAQEAIATLEHDLGTTVISSLTASLWRALQTASIAPESPGWGRLLEPR